MPSYSDHCRAPLSFSPVCGGHRPIRFRRRYSRRCNLAASFSVQSQHIHRHLLIEKVPLLRSASAGSCPAGFHRGGLAARRDGARHANPKYFGFLTITHEEGQLLVYGDDWNPEDPGSQISLARRATQIASFSIGTRRAPACSSQRCSATHAFTSFRSEAGSNVTPGNFSTSSTTARRFMPSASGPDFSGPIRGNEAKFEAAKRFWEEIEPKIKDSREPRIDRDFV